MPRGSFFIHRTWCALLEVSCMQRPPKRKAACDALHKIQRVREWEEMPESSKRFRACAAQIEAEFQTEETLQHVRAEDLEEETHAVSESDNESYTADSFVEHDEAEDSSEDFEATTQAFSVSETSSSEDSECEDAECEDAECEDAEGEDAEGEDAEGEDAEGEDAECEDAECEDAECESIDDAGTEQISSAEQQSIGACGLVAESDGLPQQED